MNLPDQKEEAKPEEKPLSPEQQKLMDEVSSLLLSNEKIEFILKRMEESISSKESPNFKGFWGARHCCMLLFKHLKLPPVARAEFWSRYINLTEESQRLKDLIHEQSAFAAEQIELTIKTIEGELDQISLQMSEIPAVAIPDAAKTLDHSKQQYLTIQKELTLLNGYASRVNELRKELLKMEMKKGHKHTLLKRLSHIGDVVFPKRKELIQTISEMFKRDIKKFVGDHFSPGQIRGKYYLLREEVKALQATAKIFTINTPSFTECRMSLSECWDRLREADKDRKKDLSEKKALFSENAKLMEQELEKYHQEKEGMDQKVLFERLQQLELTLRKFTLGHKDLTRFRDLIRKEKDPILAEKKSKQAEDEARKKKIKEEKKNQVAEIKNKFEQAVLSVEKETCEKSEALLQELEEEFRASKLKESDQEEIKEFILSFKSALLSKKVQDALQDQKKGADFFEVLLDDAMSLQEIFQKEHDRVKKEESKPGHGMEQALSLHKKRTILIDEMDKLDELLDRIEERIGG